MRLITSPVSRLGRIGNHPITKSILAYWPFLEGFGNTSVSTNDIGCWSNLRDNQTSPPNGAIYGLADHTMQVSSGDAVWIKSGKGSVLDVTPASHHISNSSAQDYGLYDNTIPFSINTSFQLDTQSDLTPLVAIMGDYQPYAFGVNLSNSSNLGVSFTVSDGQSSLYNNASLSNDTPYQLGITYNGLGGTNCDQTIGMTVSGGTFDGTGTFTLTFISETTTAIAVAGLTPAIIESALEALSTINVGNVSVVAHADNNGTTIAKYNISFKNRLGGMSFPVITIDSSAVGITGGSTLTEVQTITTQGAMNPSNWKMYLNGVEQTLSEAPSSPTLSNNQTGFNYGVSFGGGLDGKIGPTCVWQRQLSPIEINDFQNDPYLPFSNYGIGAAQLVNSLPIFGIASGGMTLGGISTCVVKAYFIVTPEGGMTLGGSSSSFLIIAYSHEATGGVLCSGDAIALLRHSHTPSGGIICEGEAEIRSAWSFYPGFYFNAVPFAKPIVISHEYVDQDLTNFPLLVEFSGDADIGGAALSDGADIRFANATGSLLGFEKELFQIDGGLASGRYWVNVPLIDGIQDTTIFIGYGNPTLSDASDNSAAWDNSFAGVYHLNGNYTDSTGTQNMTGDDLVSTSNETQIIGVVISGSGAFSGGSFTLTFDGETTVPINVSGLDASTVLSALENLTTIGAGNISLAAHPENDGLSIYKNTITFIGDLAGLNQPQMTIDSSLVGFTGGTKTEIETTVQDGGLSSPGIIDGCFRGTGTEFASGSSNALQKIGILDATIEAWVKYSAPSTEEFSGDRLGYIFGVGGLANSRGLALFTYNDLPTFQLRTNLVTRSAQTVGQYNDGEWHYLCASVKRDANEGITLFIDGEYFGLTLGESPLALQNVNLTDSSDIRIGSNISDDFHFKGEVDECRLSIGYARPPAYARFVYHNITSGQIEFGEQIQSDANIIVSGQVIPLMPGYNILEHEPDGGIVIAGVALSDHESTYGANGMTHRVLITVPRRQTALYNFPLRIPLSLESYPIDEFTFEDLNGQTLPSVRLADTSSFQAIVFIHIPSNANAELYLYYREAD